MIEKPELLSIVTSHEGDTVYVHADLNGLKKLRASIDSMISQLEVDECEKFSRPIVDLSTELDICNA